MNQGIKERGKQEEEDLFTISCQKAACRLPFVFCRKLNVKFRR